MTEIEPERTDPEQGDPRENSDASRAPRERLTSRRLAEARARRAFGEQLMQLTPRALVTRVLIGLNVLVFAIMIVAGVSPTSPTVGELLTWGALFGPSVVDGELWRIVSAGFVHIGAVHLLLNMWCLARAGSLAERLFGPGAFLAIYGTGLIGGSLASLAWQVETVSAGASGAVFGVFGSLLAAFWAHHGEVSATLFREHWKSTALFLFVGYNLVYGAITPQIDNAAHIGGLVAGFLAGWCLFRTVTTEATPIRPRLRWTAGLVGALGVLGLTTQQRLAAAPPRQLVEFFRQGREAFEAGNYALAAERYGASLELDAENGLLYAYRGDAYWAAEDWSSALEDYERALVLGVNAETVTNLYERLALEPRIRAVEAHRQSLVAHDAGDSELAMSKLNEALEHDPDYGLGYLIRADVRWAAQDWLPAIEDYERALELGLEPDTQAHVRERLAVSPELLRSVDLFNEGRAASEAGDYQLAVTKFTQLIDLDPGDPVGYLWRGDSHWSLEAWTEATEDYERAIQLGVEPENEAAARKRIAEKH